MNERVRRHVRLTAATLAVLLAAGVGYIELSGGSARAQPTRAVAHVHTSAPVLAAASLRPAASVRSLVAASASQRHPAPSLAPASPAARRSRTRTAAVGVPTPAPSPRGLAQALKQATGLTPAQVTSRPVCPRAAPGHASCAAQTLVLRSTGAPVHPHVAGYHSLGRVAPAQRHGAHPASTAAATPPTPGTPAYLQQAYDLTALSQTGGAGDTVAIVDPYDDPTAEADLGVFRSTYGLPACTTANGCFRKVNQQGAASPLPAGDATWAMEASLDLDAVSALCPNCHILVVEASSAGSTDLSAAMKTAANLGANQISASWTLHASSGTYTFPGVATVAATGDSGYVGTSTDNFPAALAGVTAAGGTTLAPASGAGGPRGFSEGAWAGSGSGCAASGFKPSYQTDKGCTRRAYGDLSADADPTPGFAVYDSAAPNNHWITMGGTSLATPLIAAYYAITRVPATSPQWAYGDSGLLNDIASGSNGTCAANIAYICNAGVGYDGPTGVGSISGSVVTGAPGIGGPDYGSDSAASYTQSVRAHGATIAGGVYPNGLDTTWWIEYGTTNAYGQQTAATDIGSGTAPASVTGYLSHLAPGTTYHYRVVASNTAGTTYGYDYTFATAAASPTDPTAAFASAPTVPSPGAPASFNGTTSTDSGASITHYGWIFGDGTTGSGATPTHTYAARGMYYVTLIVTNSAGQSDSTTRAITIDISPTATFTAPAGVQLAGSPLSFDGSGSTSSGTNTTYSWDFGDGSTTSASTPTAAHTYTSAGAFTVKLTVTDDLGVSATSSRQVRVDKPTAAFTIPPAVIAPGALATFDPGTSTDPYGSIVDYSWDFGDGGAPQDSATRDPVVHPYTARGQYTVALTITNSYGQTSTISHTLTVDNPPTAAFTAPPTVAAPDTSINFDATQSSAGLGGTIRHYNWSFGDGAATDTYPSPVASHSYASPGVYAVTLTITDDLGVTAVSTQQVTVDQPTAAFNGPATAVAPYSPATFDPSASTDPYGSIVSYSWDFGDGTQQPTTTKDPVVHTYKVRGRYIVALTVTNSYSQTSSPTTRAVTVDTPPTAAFTPSTTVATSNASIGFDATQSSAGPGGTITDYRWSFGDGSTADTGTSARAVHAYAAAGAYTVSLTATDDLGLSATVTQRVTVNAPAATVPTNPSPPQAAPTPPAATSPPAPSPPAPSPLAANLTAAGKQRLAAVLAHGPRLVLSVNQRASASFQITIPAAHAKRGSKTVLLRGVRTIAAGGHTITLKLSRTAVAQLRARGLVVLTIRVTLTGAGGPTLTRTAKITLTR